MKKRYYLDTCIWIDYAENRLDRFRPLGEWAFKLLKKIVAESSLIVMSDVIYQELYNNGYSDEKIKAMLKIINTLSIVNRISNKMQVIEAKHLSRERQVPFADALHAVLARDSNALCITRDIHFKELLDVVNSAKPEDLI